MTVDLPPWLQQLISPEQLASATRAVILVVVGFALARVLKSLVTRGVHRVGTPERAVLAGRVATYSVMALTVASAARELGFDLSVLMGAAGVLTVAVGFASQTSASNFISGLFLIGERPFSIGDSITLGTTTGEVIGIDLLSVKLRTFDNLYVRIPNETVMKAEIVNLSRFPIRRLEMPMCIAYQEDLGKVRELLLELAALHPLVLDEPAAAVRFTAFGPSGVDLTFQAWTLRENLLMVRDELSLKTKVTLEQAGVEIPFPHVSLHAGRGSAPLQVQLLAPDPADALNRRDFTSKTTEET